MKKIKKILALSVGLVMTASLFTGCSNDGLALMNAFSKSQTINSMESKTDISVKVSASNMSAQEKEIMNAMLPMINGAKMSVLTKTNQNEEKTKAKMQSDIDLQAGQMSAPISMSAWIDVDIAADEPVINYTFKMPQLITSQLPKELQGKDYMVMNLDDMTSAPGMYQPDYKKSMSFSKEFVPKFDDFIFKYAKQFNPTTEYITHVGGFFEENGNNWVDTYEIKLTDKSFKSLMHYTVNNLSENKDAMNFVKEYMSSMMSIYDTTDPEYKSIQDEMNKSLDNLTTELPQQLVSLNKTLDSIDNLKILGDNGITIKYVVNQDGYIVNEKVNAEFVVDLPSIIKLTGSSEEAMNPSNPTGIYTINISSNTDITNINEDVNIVFPKVDSTNSFNYTDIMNMYSTELPIK